MQHRFSVQDIVHHLEVAKFAQQGFAAEINNDRLATQFRRQADDASDMANVFADLDTTSGARRVFLDGDQLVVEVA